MNADEIMIASAITLWKSTVSRADKIFAELSESDGSQRVAPGRNRIVYLLGHLTAVHDAMIPLLRLGDRIHPELDDVFVKNPDRAAADLPTFGDLRNLWENVNGHLLVLLQQGLSAAWWAERHASASEEEFLINPTRNRLSILLSRTNHLSYHLGQIVLAPRASGGS
jgi:hypothetical protein